VKTQILNTLKLAYTIKLLCKSFFTLAPLPEFVQTKNNASGELDIHITNAPKDYTYKFFIAKDTNELRLGNFYSVEVIKDSVRVIVTQHISYEDLEPMLLDEDSIIMQNKKNFGCSQELVENLNLLFSSSMLQ
jgi:hypothetical protein